MGQRKVLVWETGLLDRLDFLGEMSWSLEGEAGEGVQGVGLRKTLVWAECRVVGD